MGELALTQSSWQVIDKSRMCIDPLPPLFMDTVTFGNWALIGDASNILHARRIGRLLLQLIGLVCDPRPLSKWLWRVHKASFTSLNEAPSSLAYPCFFRTPTIQDIIQERYCKTRVLSRCICSLVEHGTPFLALTCQTTSILVNDPSIG